jgi:hypothetical protein
MRKLLIVALAAASCAYGQQSFAAIRVIGGVVTMNGTNTNGGYLDYQPVADNMPGGPCYDEFLNKAQQPAPAVSSFTFGANDLLMWNSLSPEVPSWCGVTPLTVNYIYGINTNGYFYGMAGLATGSPYWNGVQNLRGGMSAESFTAARYYPGGTTTTAGIMGGGVVNVTGTTVTLVSGDPFVGGQESPGAGWGLLLCASLPCRPDTGLGYNIASVTDATHLVLAVSATGSPLSNYSYVLTLGKYLGGYMYTGHSVGAPGAGSIATVTNPLSDGQGLSSGIFYFEDSNAAYPTYYPCIRYYNAAVLAGDHFGCIGDISEVYNSFADKDRSPSTTVAFTTSGGNYKVWGDGQSQGQTYSATTFFKSLADTAGSPSTTPAFELSAQAAVIWGDGSYAGKIFNATATGTAIAFQTSSLYAWNGQGDIGLRSATLGNLGSALTGIAGGVLLSATTSGLYASVNGAAPVLLGGGGTVPGISSDVIYNNAGALGASGNFQYDSSLNELLIGPGGSLPSIAAPLLNAYGTSGECFEVNSNTAQISCAGAIAGQSLALTAGLTVGNLGSALTGIAGGVLLSATTSGLYASVNGAAPVLLGGGGTVPGISSDVIYNNAGALGASGNFQYYSSLNELLIGPGGSLPSMAAPLLNAYGTSGECVEVNSNTAQISCAGAIAGQSLALTAGLTVDSGAYGISSVGFATLVGALVGASGLSVTGTGSFSGAGGVVSTYGFNVLSGGAYYAGGVTGVACSGSPTAGFAVSMGIVTHC